jgi:ABC-2 type transport system permease protein
MRLRQLATITRTLAWSEFKLRYAGSALGYFWSVAKPMMLFGVLYLVFHRMLRFGEGIPRFPEMLLLGIVLWTFFAETTSGSVTVLVQRADMLRKVAFPPIALPFAVAATASLALLFNLGTVMLLLLVSGVRPTIHWLWFPALAGELFLVTLGVGLIISALFVTMRDIGQVWDVMSQLLFYATPIIYPLAMLSDSPIIGDVSWRMIAVFNPMGQIIEQSRLILVQGESGSLSAVLPGAWIIVPYAIVAASVVIGAILFKRASVQMVEQL